MYFGKYKVKSQISSKLWFWVNVVGLSTTVPISKVPQTSLPLENVREVVT